MVNEKKNPKKYILEMLREKPATVSGQQISDSLNISRVAVWKHIKSLQELGYKIEGSSSGYHLDERFDEDHLFSWEFDSVQSRILTYRELNSTMDIAREQAEKGCESFTTIIAEKQKQGKGRGSRNWISNEGGLYFTTVIRPALPSAYNYIYTLAATASLSEVIKDLYNKETFVKWPNDVLVDNRKISGVLTEIHMTGDSMNWLNLGVGINVNNTPGLAQSSSLQQICGKRVDRRLLLEAFEKTYRSMLSENNPGEIRTLWKKHSSMLHKNIILKTDSGRVLKGKMEDIDEGGALLIRDSDNQRHQALFGDLYIKDTN